MCPNEYSRAVWDVLNPFCGENSKRLKALNLVGIVNDFSIRVNYLILSSLLLGKRNCPTHAKAKARRLCNCNLTHVSSFGRKA